MWTAIVITALAVEALGCDDLSLPEPTKKYRGIVADIPVLCSRRTGYYEFECRVSPLVSPEGD